MIEKLSKHLNIAGLIILLLGIIMQLKEDIRIIGGIMIGFGLVTIFKQGNRNT